MNELLRFCFLDPKSLRRPKGYAGRGKFRMTTLRF
jgi:hypothetical protein